MTQPSVRWAVSWCGKMVWYETSKAPESITSSIIGHPWTSLLGWIQWSWLCPAMSFGTKSLWTWRQAICGACWSISEAEVDMDSMDSVMISQNQLKRSARFNQGKSRQDLHWELQQHCAWHYRTGQLQSWIGCGLALHRTTLRLFPERRVYGLSIDQLCMIMDLYGFVEFGSLSY